MSLDPYITEDELKKYREELRKKQEEHLKRLKKEREKEQKKKEQEKAMQEEAERKRHQAFIDSWQQGWTVKHKELYKQMCELVGDLRTAMIDLSSDSERNVKLKMLLQEFIREPLNLGETSLSQILIYEVLYYGWILQIYKENNTWKLKVPSDCPHNLKLIVENSMPVAIEVTMRNELIPFIPLKGVLKLKK